MNENKFLKKFQDKTNTELENIISNPKKYVEQARLAAIELLKRRTENSTKYENIKKEIEIKKNRKQQKNNQIPKLKAKHALSPFKWILIILFFPISLIFVGYYNQKRNKKTYWNQEKK